MKRQNEEWTGYRVHYRATPVSRIKRSEIIVVEDQGGNPVSSAET
jgi:hypothetical protein